MKKAYLTLFKGNNRETRGAYATKIIHLTS